ncbi:CapA family protein [Vibrio sp. Isolate30]|uniref:CapA family protein n=1 Tax=Vibrio sp. Isolate30 TaxID=2908536 RepID=UPI001EFC62CD|nr:CapA family protein [Vibrio sp. Isolate30]MCG9632641.1 CapA family protein [Vibrio sp. Isolate30]
MTKKKILLLGDICPTEDTVSYFNNGDSDNLLGELKSVIVSSDIVVGNLEYPIVSKSKAIEKCGPTLSGTIESLHCLKKCGFDILSLANNHIGDYGSEGVVETLDSCNLLGIPSFGAGKNIEDAANYHVQNVQGKKIGFVSFAEHEFNAATRNDAGANIFDPYTSFDFIREVKEKTDYLIVLYHGGVEYYRYPSPELMKKCRKFIESGADLVSCQHSHCVGAEEDYLDGKIVYGQGNSIYGYRKNHSMWNEGLAISIEVSNEGIELSYIAFNWTSSGIRLETDRTVILDKFMERSHEIQNKDFVTEKWLDFCSTSSAHYLPMYLGLSVNTNRLNRVLKNGIIDTLYTKRQKMVSNNIIRCNSHYEVIRTILQSEED